ncbi:family 88 glycosyl hydrolase [Cytophagales bacterium WSM2-2]|nr:family 88 glycosyl hydrolase [Cytophagales bacterium WSM2-2]
MLSSNSFAKGTDKLLFTVKRNYDPVANEKATLILDWNEVVKRLTGAKTGVTLMDWNFGREVKAFFADRNNDGITDELVMDYVFPSNDPVFTFYLQPSTTKNELAKGTAERNSKFEITFLTSSSQAKPVKNWPDKIIQSTMQFYPDATKLFINAPGKWNYEMGFFLSAMFLQSQRKNNNEYVQYIQRWADRFINAEGKIDAAYYDPKEYKLDDIIPGRPALFLYEKTKDAKYKSVADQLMDQLEHQPKTTDGGYWHKEIYPNQMWLDGIYMADVFSTQYAKVFNKPAWFDEAIRQIKLVARHATDAKTGLLRHGWDESKNKVWADQETGASPEVWARAVGWYMMALVECLDYVPENHPERKELIDLLKSISKSVLKYLDTKSNLWFQVVDKGSREGNWIETSGSAMFTYAFAKGFRKGYLDKSCQVAARKAFDSLIKNYVYFDDSGRLYLDQTVKVGTLNLKNSKGDYQYYISTERRINDYKGLGALLFASLELE